MLAFELKLGSKEVEICDGNVGEGVVMFNQPGEMNMTTLTNENQPYSVLMVEDRSCEQINFFIKDGIRLFAAKGDVKFFFGSENGFPYELAQMTIQNSIMGAIWKDKKMRHRSPKGFKWTDDLNKADALVLDLELLNCI